MFKIPGLPYLARCSWSVRQMILVVLDAIPKAFEIETGTGELHVFTIQLSGYRKAISMSQLELWLLHDHLF